jgi:hypothetical protein
MWSECVNWIHLAQKRELWRALANIVTNTNPYNVKIP